MRQLLAAVLFLFGLSYSNVFAKKTDEYAKEGGRYYYYLIDSPSYDVARSLVLPAYHEIIFDLNDRYVFVGKESYNLESCRLNILMMCFIDPSQGFVLYIPRIRDQWTKWKHENQTYVFEGWKHLPFLQTKFHVGVIHVFDNDMMEDRQQNGGIAYPQATFFIDKKVQLLGMMRYELSEPGHRGLNENRISAFYWAKGPGLPIADY